MQSLSVVVAVWIGSLAMVAGQSTVPPPVFVVRLDPGPEAARDGDRRPDSGSSPQAVPGSPRAAAGPLQPLPVTRLDESAAAAVLDSPRQLSLRFSEPQSVRQVLMLLVRDTGLSLVAAPDAEGTFAGELSGVTLRQALDLVLGSQGLEYRVDDNAIRVFRRETETRIFDVNAIAARREGNTTGDAFDDLARSLASVLSPVGRLGVDRKAGLVHVTDYPERIARAESYIESVERRLGRQVEIEARVIEVTFADDGAAGIDWNTALAQARTGPGAAGTVDLPRLLHALGARGTVQVVTTTDLRVLHNEQAVIRAARAFADFSLAVTPSVASDGTILLTVAPAVSRPDRDGSGEAGARDTLEIDTAVRVRDGETLVLPGIRHDRSEMAVLLTTKVI